MKGDWRMRLVGVQAIWLVAFFTCMTLVYLARPHYAPGPAFEAAHSRWETTLTVVGGAALAVSFAITAWFSRRYRSKQPPGT